MRGLGRTRRVGLALTLGLIAGGVVALSIPPFGWYPLAWIGLGGLALALRRASWRRRCLIGFSFGLSQYFIGEAWVHEFSVVGYVVLALLSALYDLVACALVPTSRRWGIGVCLPCTLLLAEWVRDRFPLGGFPMAGIALGQVKSPDLWVLRLGGSTLLTAEAVVIGVVLATVATFVMAIIRDHHQVRRGLVWSLLLVAAALALPIAGWLSPSGSGGRLSTLDVALVQGGGARGTRAIYTNPQTVFDRHLTESQKIRGPANLVIWPEGVFQSHVPFQNTDDSSEVAALAETLDATVLVGVEQDVGTSQYYNEEVAWSPTGEIVSSYRKNHLVPFGEYVPWRSFIQHFFSLQAVPLDAVPGHSPAILQTPQGKLGIMISFEVFFDHRALSAVKGGAAVLVVPTDTASYRSTQVPTQEMAASQMRAVETGRWLVQVSPTGYSLVVDPGGDVLTRTHLDSAAVVQYAVPRRTGHTVFDDVGDAPYAWVALAVVLATCLVALNDRRTSV